MDIDNTIFGLICGIIILIASTLTAVVTIYNVFKNPAKKIKEKHDTELKEKICETLKEILPTLLKEHDIELRDRYRDDRARYLEEIKTSVLKDTQHELNQVKILGLQYESLVISAKDILREKIIKIYNDNKENKTLTVLDSEKLEQFYKDYKELKGNSYIDKYYNRMKKWETIDDDYNEDDII